MRTDSSSAFIPRKIVSGGQTGVDRAGLDVAIALNLEHGGWCPKGRLSEDGSIPSRYCMSEMDSPDYPPRTEQNVIDSNATLILFEHRLKGGTSLTKRLAKRWDRPLLCVDLISSTPDQLCVWLAATRPETLNVAGPRESNFPGIGERALAFLLGAFSH